MVSILDSHTHIMAGPYALGIGVSLFLVNKEIFLIDDFEFQHLIAFIMWMYVLTKSSLGTKILEFLRKGDSVLNYTLLSYFLLVDFNFSKLALMVVDLVNLIRF